MHFVFVVILLFVFFFFKQKTAYEMRISDWSSDVCSSDLSGRYCRACLRGAADGSCRSRRTATTTRTPMLSQGAVPVRSDNFERRRGTEIGRASCRERVCQYV